MSDNEDEQMEPRRVYELLFGEKLIAKPKGKAVNLEKALGDRRLVAVYFSASWCAPCRGFTPILTNFYNAAQKKCPGQLEIVFVSKDADGASFEKYFEKMPWLAIPYEEEANRTQLERACNVNGIPALVVFTPEGVIRTANGRSDIDPDKVEEVLAKWMTMMPGEDAGPKRASKHIRLAIFFAMSIFMFVKGNTMAAVMLLVMMLPRMFL